MGGGSLNQVKLKCYSESSFLLTILLKVINGPFVTKSVRSLMLLEELLIFMLFEKCKRLLIPFIECHFFLSQQQQQQQQQRISRNPKTVPYDIETISYLALKIKVPGNIKNSETLDLF